MEEPKQPSAEAQLIANILVKEEMIEENLHKISKLFPEFSLDWLTAVEKNYDSFLNYLTLAIKIHYKNRTLK